MGLYDFSLTFQENLINFTMSSLISLAVLIPAILILDLIVKAKEKRKVNNRKKRD